MKAEVKQVGGKWSVEITFDNQGFRLASCEDKESAEWMKSMLEKAFRNSVLSIIEQEVGEVTESRTDMAYVVCDIYQQCGAEVLQTVNRKLGGGS